MLVWLRSTGKVHLAQGESHAWVDILCMGYMTFLVGDGPHQVEVLHDGMALADYEHACKKCLRIEQLTAVGYEAKETS